MRIAFWIVLLVLTTALIAADLPGVGNASPPTAEPTEVQATCSYGEWPVPHQLEGVPPGSMIRWPRLALHDDGAYVVGNNVLWFDNEPVPQQPLVAFDLAGRDLGKPAGDFRFIYPMAVADPDGTLHLLWAEPVASSHALTGRDWVHEAWELRSLWYAQYKPVRGWSRPEQIFEPENGLKWNHFLGDVTLGTEGQVYAVAGTYNGLRLLRRAGNRWTVHPTPVPDLALYSRVKALPDGGIGLVYMGEDPSGLSESDNNIVFLSTTTRGPSWRSPRTIFQADHPAPQDVSILPARGDTIHILWAEGLPGTMGRGSIHVATSHDQGFNWKLEKPLPPTEPRNNVQGAVDQCGALHVTFQTWDWSDDPDVSDKTELWYARWKNGWTSPERPFPELSSVEVEIGVRSDGAVQLFWSSRPITSLRRTVYRPVLSELVVGDR